VDADVDNIRSAHVDWHTINRCSIHTHTTPPTPPHTHTHLLPYTPHYTTPTHAHTHYTTTHTTRYTHTHTAHTHTHYATTTHCTFYYTRTHTHTPFPTHHTRTRTTPETPTWDISRARAGRHSHAWRQNEGATPRLTPCLRAGVRNIRCRASAPCLDPAFGILVWRWRSLPGTRSYATRLRGCAVVCCAHFLSVAPFSCARARWRATMLHCLAPRGRGSKEGGSGTSTYTSFGCCFPLRRDADGTVARRRLSYETIGHGIWREWPAPVFTEHHALSLPAALLLACAVFRGYGIAASLQHCRVRRLVLTPLTPHPAPLALVMQRCARREAPR